MRIASVLVVVSVLLAQVACSSSGANSGGQEAPSSAEAAGAPTPKLEEPEPATPTPDLDAQVERFLGAPGLDREHFPDWGKARSQKMSEANEVNDAVKARIASSKDRDVRAHLSIQRARIFLAVACQMVGIVPAPGATEEEARQTKVYGEQASDLFFPGADESLRDAVGFDGARSPEAGQMLLALRAMDDRAVYCAEHRSLWRT